MPLLLVGTSAVVWSGFRLARRASERGLPIAAVNDGRTRADNLLRFKLGGDCGTVLLETLAELGINAAEASIKTGISREA